jgi:carbon monoxide dehydrogenase subunit G
MNHSGKFLTTRTSEEVFDRVADPQHFAALLPDFESLSMQDATHFTMRIAVAAGQIRGHVNLAMELREVVRPSRVEYRGQGTVAGSQFNFAMQFGIAPLPEATEVSWQGEVSVEGMLVFMAGSMIDELGRRNLDMMAEQLHNKLREDIVKANRPPHDNGFWF